MAEASPEMQEYFDTIEKNVGKAYSYANKARAKKYDPEDKVDIVLAKNMAERVEGLIREVAPQLVGIGMVQKIQDYETQYKRLDWRVGFKIAEDVAKQKFCTFKNDEEAMEVGIKVGFAYLTLGIVSAPLEGFTFLKVKQRKDGGNYVSLWYSGPVRGAGGTAAATSVVLGDYVRSKMGYGLYDPTEEEVNRYVTEIQNYHERVTNLQYFPSEEEIKFMTSHLPVEVNGEPTEKFEVSNYKDLPRVETNLIRGGICLVLAEGLCQKSAKIWLRLSKWGVELGLSHWGFLKDFLELQKKVKARKTQEKTQQKKITPNYVFIQDLVAGRPVLTYPMKEGGFRLRYGRSRMSGFSSASIHPATMHLLNKYIATGTQLKMERPGKATALTPNDYIEGPVVKMNDGSILRVDNESDAEKIKDMVKEILFLGDILISYGDFSENGHILAPCGYNEEWYVRELEASLKQKWEGNWKEELKKQKLGHMEPEKIISLILNPQKTKLTAAESLSISKEFKIPMHPYFTYHWNLSTPEKLEKLLSWFSSMKPLSELQDSEEKIIVSMEEEPKNISDQIGIPCTVVNNEYVVYNKEDSLSIFSTFNAKTKEEFEKIVKIFQENKDKKPLEIINQFSSVEIRDKSGTFIGARMGRPEKSKMRKLASSPHTLFPIGEEGGRLRSIQSAAEEGKITADFPIYKCETCDKNTIYGVCETCDKPTTKLYDCTICGLIKTPLCKLHGKAKTYKKQSIVTSQFLQAAINKLGMKTYPDLIKGVRGTSNRDHIPENFAKGILRAKHDLFVNKDGTIRYDMTELPMTHFKPKEIGTSVEKLKKIGYTHDMDANLLESSDQTIELKPQDIILPAALDGTDEAADDVLFRVSKFIDELLTNFYGLKPYYNFSDKSDVVGELVIGLAPHISAGMIGRIIGFSETQACFAHPLWHAALRRDCDGDECCVSLLMDGLLNFSRQFLPDRRGSRTMDSPLVLTSKLNPSEVDDMVHGLDVVSTYPLEFYNAAQEMKNAWEIKIEQLGQRLNTELQYEKIKFTHQVSSMNIGVKCSAYKTLPSMEEKLKGQMEIAERIRAVDESDVARLVIEKHFLKDIRGNLRKFSQQEFRCVKCNSKYRRPPLMGKCTKCAGRLLFTVSEGSILKYLEPSISLANKYHVSTYLKQTLELTKVRVEGVFGKDAEKQTGLGSWFG